MSRVELFLQEIGRREPLYFQQRAIDEKDTEYAGENYSEHYYKVSLHDVCDCCDRCDDNDDIDNGNRDYLDRDDDVLDKNDDVCDDYVSDSYDNDDSDDDDDDGD